MTQRGRAGGRQSPRARPGPGRRDPSHQPAGGSRPRGDQPAGGPRPRGDLAAGRERLRAVVEPVVTGAGYDLEDLILSRAGRRHLVRVVVDADGGVQLDAVADVARAVSAALDAADEAGGELLAGEYQLEVSSPGVDRPLTLPRHWRRNVGRLVRVAVGGRQVTGRLVGADDDGVVLDVDGATHEARFTELGPGRVQVEFNRPDDGAQFDQDGDFDSADLDGGDFDDEDFDGEDLDGDDEDGEDEER